MDGGMSVGIDGAGQLILFFSPFLFLFFVSGAEPWSKWAHWNLLPLPLPSPSSLHLLHLPLSWFDLGLDGLIHLLGLWGLFFCSFLGRQADWQVGKQASGIYWQTRSCANLFFMFFPTLVFFSLPNGSIQFVYFCILHFFSLHFGYGEGAAGHLGVLSSGPGYSSAAYTTSFGGRGSDGIHGRRRRTTLSWPRRRVLYIGAVDWGVLGVGGGGWAE